MKYKFLSIVVVLCTTITVIAMLLGGDMLKGFSNQKGVGVVQKNNIKNQSGSKTTTKDNSSSKTEAKNTQEKQEIDQNNNDEEKEVEEETDVFPQEGLVIIDRRNEKDPNDKTSGQVDYPESTAVFKVESTSIAESLSLIDKAKLLGVAAKISPVDYAKINNYLYDDNSARGIINTFSLLKTRLSESDYEKVKDIAEKYMDVNRIESYIN